MNIAILMLSALSVCSVSCSPVYSVKRYGISATLTHANTAAPIIETPIVVTVDGDKFNHQPTVEAVSPVRIPLPFSVMPMMARPNTIEAL
ncbi:hypothetical protein OAF41_00160 [bacterium]|nr:hypothetical protein [bacterium]